MSTWKRIHEQATGALPVATLTKWGALLIAGLLGVFLVTQSVFNTGPEEEEPVTTGAEEPAGPGTQAQIRARIREESIRQEAQRQAAERTQLAQQRQQELGIAPPSATASLMPSGVIGGDPIVPSSEAEAELREVLRLEEIERRRRSLRSAPVAQTYRGMNDAPPATTPATAATTGSESAPRISEETQTAQNFAPPPAVNQALQQSIDMLGEAVADWRQPQPRRSMKQNCQHYPECPDKSCPPDSGRQQKH